jgi:hypothetical protein
LKIKESINVKEMKINCTTISIWGAVDPDDEKVAAVWVSFGRSGYLSDPEALLSGYSAILSVE